MDKSPSWEATSPSATQEFIEVLRNPKVHYRDQESPPLVPILSQMNPVHKHPTHFSKIHPNITHPPLSTSSQWPLSFRLSHQNPICSLLPLRAAYPPHLTLLDSITLIIFGEEYKLWKSSELYSFPTPNTIRRCTAWVPQHILPAVSLPQWCI
jgi:hypothetical protein